MKLSVQNLSNGPFVARKLVFQPCKIIIVHNLTVCNKNNVIFNNKIKIYNGENRNVVQNIF